MVLPQNLEGVLYNILRIIAILHVFHNEAINAIGIQFHTLIVLFTVMRTTFRVLKKLQQAVVPFLCFAWFISLSVLLLVLASAS
jgi:hypothetical protein